jgi:hypothetical protein
MLCVVFSTVLSVATLVLTSAEQRSPPQKYPQESAAHLKAIRLSFLRSKDHHFHPTYWLKSGTIQFCTKEVRDVCLQDVLLAF